MKLVEEIAAAVSPETGLSEELAWALEEVEGEEVVELFPLTAALRQAASGRGVYLCSIVNAKSGRCAEDCRFCAQSAHYHTAIREYPLLSVEEILRAARQAKENGAGEFSIVTSGKGISSKAEISRIKEAIAEIAALGLSPCVSPGIVKAETLERWREAGLGRFHHNLETAPSLFPQICSTHPITEDIEVIKTAKELGLPVCCGGIFGLGETWAQRVELAALLRELNVDSVPLNFLNPIPGTPLASRPRLRPWEALKIIALFRLMLPRTRLILCGGREVTLRSLQPLIFAAGANGLLVGNYLTTSGRPASEDLEMLADLELEPARP